MRQYTLTLKIAGLVLLSLAFAFLFLQGFYFTAILTGLVILVIAFSLYSDQQKSIRRMEQMIAHIHYGDLNLSFPTPNPDSPEGKLRAAMSEALSVFRERLYHSVISEAETEAWQKLIRVLTHEIMNSIAPIISLSETMTDRAVADISNEKEYELMRQAMQTIHRRSKGLLDFVENYRKLTRIPSPVIQPFAVEGLFREMKALLPMESIRFTTGVKPENLYLHADRSLIEQVIINLLKNAVEACKDAGDPSISLTAFHQEGKVAISVSDNGRGILPEAVDKVFVPFYTTKQGGSGIGLSVCRQIMNRHGGTITVTTGESNGTVFTLLFNGQETFTRR